MGNKLFGVDISGIIAREIGPGVLDAVLTKFTPGTLTTGRPTAGTNPTSSAPLYPCKGFIDKQAQKDLSGTLVADGQKAIVLIGDTIDSGNVAPEVGDHITIEGTAYIIEVLDRDPAAATYTAAAKPV